MFPNAYDHVAPELLPEMSVTERELEKLANEALATSVVEVHIENCKHPFISLHPKIRDSIEESRRPNTVNSVSLELEYSRAESRFDIIAAGINFDSTDVLLFRRIQAPYFKQTGKRLFYGALIDKEGYPLKKTDETDLMHEDEVASVLKAVGVELPAEQQEAKWESIQAILQFAGGWMAEASHTIPISPTSSIFVTDRIDGKGMDIATQALASDDGVFSREITFCVDESRDPAEAPTTTWKIQASSNGYNETPCIKGIYRAPLRFVLPSIPDFGGMEILGEMPIVRQEVREKQVLLPLDSRYLTAAHACIVAANGEAA